MRIESINANRIYVVGEDDVKLLDRILEQEDKEGTTFVRATNIEGIYDYGYQQKKADYMGNPTGYIWSSRAGVMNKVFNTKLIEVAYAEDLPFNSFSSYAIDLNILEPLLEETNYMIDWTPTITDTDVVYRLVKKA